MLSKVGGWEKRYKGGLSIEGVQTFCTLLLLVPLLLLLLGLLPDFVLTLSRCGCFLECMSWIRVNILSHVVSFFATKNKSFFPIFCEFISISLEVVLVTKTWGIYTLSKFAKNGQMAQTLWVALRKCQT